MVVAGVVKCLDTIQDISNHFSTLLLGHLLCLAHDDGFRDGQVLLLEQVLDGISIMNAFDVLVSNILLQTFIVAELACFCHLSE